MGLDLSELETIGNDVFKGYANFKGDEDGLLYLPLLTRIGNSAFEGTKVETVVISQPNIIVNNFVRPEIGDNAFKQCNALDAMYVGLMSPTNNTALKVFTNGTNAGTTPKDTFADSNDFTIYVSGIGNVAAWTYWLNTLGGLKSQVAVEAGVYTPPAD
jgi:hypothetical protein